MPPSSGWRTEVQKKREETEPGGGAVSLSGDNGGDDGRGGRGGHRGATQPQRGGGDVPPRPTETRLYSIATVLASTVCVTVLP